jgi:hypothetical protein
VSLSHTGGDVLAGVFDASSIDGIVRTKTTDVLVSAVLSHHVGTKDETHPTKQQQQPRQKLYQPQKQNGIMFYE